VPKKRKAKFKPPNPKNVKVTTEIELEQKRAKAERKRKLKYFGKIKKIPKRMVPNEPRIKLPVSPRRPRKKSKKNWKKSRPIYGLTVLIHGRGSGSQPGAEIHVQKKRFFEAFGRKPNPKTIAGGRAEVNKFIGAMRAKYRGRLDFIGMEIKFITKSRLEDKKHHWDFSRKKSK
jgi:hypothetical protein